MSADIVPNSVHPGLGAEPLDRGRYFQRAAGAVYMARYRFRLRFLRHSIQRHRLLHSSVKGVDFRTGSGRIRASLETTGCTGRFSVQLIEPLFNKLIR
jgi:hypothetical protein